MNNEVLNPLDPDAPIIQLLSVMHNPMVKDMSDSQLNDLIKKLRVMATSPQTMTSTLQGEAKRRRPMTEAQRKRKEILDSL
jgi:hypothetical protein